MDDPAEVTTAKATRPRRRGFPSPITADTPLRKRERVFVDEYLVALKGADAAIKAGYAPKNARAQASRLLTKANIAAAVERGFVERQQRTQTTADATVRELARVAYSDIGVYFDANGGLKPMHELTPDQRAAIASIEIVRRNLTSGDGAVEYVHKLKLWNKPRALEVLGRYQGLGDAPLDGQPDAPCFVLPADTPGVSVH